MAKGWGQGQDFMIGYKVYVTGKTSNKLPDVV